MAENQDQHGSSSQRGGESGRGSTSTEDQKQREAPSKGGSSVPAEERSFSKDRKLESEAGRKSGESSGGQPSEREDADESTRGGSGKFA